MGSRGNGQHQSHHHRLVNPINLRLRLILMTALLRGPLWAKRSEGLLQETTRKRLREKNVRDLDKRLQISGKGGQNVGGLMVSLQ
jgi:hypothetical protein